MLVHTAKLHLCAAILCLGMMQESSSSSRSNFSLDEQNRALRLQEQQCNNATHEYQENWCRRYWDGIMCWEPSPPGVLVSQPCPYYIFGSNLLGYASKMCMDDGTWYWVPDNGGIFWTNYSDCFLQKMVTVVVQLHNNFTTNNTLTESYLHTSKMIGRVGYSTSLFSLLLAFCILASIKRLRCQRNILHMNLFASFIVRAFAWLLKDLTFVGGLGFETEILYREGELILAESSENSWHCKAFVSLRNYCIMANYAWILMEGLYLHNLIFCALFADPKASILVYAIIGWGMPAVVISVWVLLRILKDNNWCWTMDEKGWVAQVIQLPTALCVLLSFGLFVNIVRVLRQKLKSTISEDTLRHKKLARSTLVLVPLFGVHYTIFLIMSYSLGKGSALEPLWILCDQLFASFQGFFVAVLYCFHNGEVRSELKRYLRAHNCLQASTHSGSSYVFSKQQQQQPQQQRDGSELCCWRLGHNCRRALHHRSTHSMASTQDVGIGTRACSLASSRDYLQVPHGRPGSGNSEACQAALCSTTDHSLLSFCSNTMETDVEACGEQQYELDQLHHADDP